MKFIIGVVSLLLALSLFASETVKGAKKDFESFKKEMSARLEKVEKEIGELKDKAKDKGGDVKDKTVTELEETRDDLKKQLNEVSETSGEKWKKFKKNFADAIDKLNSKIQNALKE